MSMPSSSSSPDDVRSPALDDRIVVAAVIKRGDAYLICQRPANKRHAGLWEFPGGKLEEGETLLKAARRELFEELDLHVKEAGALLYTVRDPDSGYEINFLEVEVEGEPKLNEHSALAWISPDRLLEFALSPSNKLFTQNHLLRPT